MERLDGTRHQIAATGLVVEALECSLDVSEKILDRIEKRTIGGLKYNDEADTAKEAHNVGVSVNSSSV